MFDMARHEKTDGMTTEGLQNGIGSPPTVPFGGTPRTAASYEGELARLRGALARDEELIRQKDELIQQREVLSTESDHRLLNSLQIIVSLLSMQSRTSANGEVASQLADAAKRVTMIERVHRHLHRFDGQPTVAFKQYLEDLCRDFSGMLALDERPEQAIVVEGIDIDLPATTAIPLGFIVNELIMNAAKYGTGRIVVRLEPNPPKGFALSVSNDGPSLPAGFDPSNCKGLGMKIIRSLVGRIGGELLFGLADKNQGARFAVLFS